jgi:hypothetical protein
MIFKGQGGTIRVVSPRTQNGKDLLYDPVTKQPIYREDFLPATAKKFIEDQNRNLPVQLQKTIELVSDGDVGVKSPEKKKPGPKPKDNAQSN